MKSTLRGLIELAAKPPPLDAGNERDRLEKDRLRQVRVTLPHLGIHNRLTIIRHRRFEDVRWDE